MKQVKDMIFNENTDKGHKLRFCDLVLLEKCMLECKMCQMWKSTSSSSEVTIEHWKKLIDSLKEVSDPNLQIQFVGGEPLLQESIFDLIKLANRNGFATTMTTNGFLINREIACQISESGLNSLVLSLDSIKEEVHDFLRGVNGVYERLMRGIDYLGEFKKENLNLYIVTTIMNPNVDDIVPLAEWVNNNDKLKHISFQAIMQPFFTPGDNEWYKKQEFSFLWPDDTSKVDNVLDNLIELKTKGYKIANPIPQLKLFKAYFNNPEVFVKSNCHLGYDSITINSAGDIFFCNSFEPIGNIRKAGNLKHLLCSERASNVRDSIITCKRNCKLMINCFFEEEKAKKL